MAQLISLTKTPRLIFLVLPSGKANLHTVNRLCSLIQKKDTVIDMSNSLFKRAEDFEKKYSLPKKLIETLDRAKTFPIDDAIQLVKKNCNVKFDSPLNFDMTRKVFS